MALYRSPDYQISFGPTGFSVQEKFYIEFEDGGSGGHLGFSIRTTLATSKLVTSHANTPNEVSSQLTFWFRRKSSK